MTSQEVQTNAFKKMSSFFGNEFQLHIMQELDCNVPDRVEWCLPISYIRWKEITNQPKGTRKADCPPEIISRRAELSDLTICGRYQSRTDIAYSILFSPTPAIASRIIMLDEIDQVVAAEQKSPDLLGRLIIESSPSNFQLWLRFDKDLSDDERVSLMRRFSPDKNSATAVRNGRFPGFANKKPKHASAGYPFAKIYWCRFGATTPAALDGVLPEIAGREERQPTYAPTPFIPDKNARRMKDRPLRDNYDRGDDSSTDFSFGLAMRTWLKNNPDDNYYGSGSIEEILVRAILQERQNWTKKGGLHSRGALIYAEKTAQNIMRWK